MEASGAGSGRRGRRRPRHWHRIRGRRVRQEEQRGLRLEQRVPDKLRRERAPGREERGKRLDGVLRRRCRAGGGRALALDLRPRGLGAGGGDGGPARRGVRPSGGLLMLRSEISRVRAAMCVGLLCVSEAACTAILGIGDPTVADDGGLGEAPMDSTVEGSQAATDEASVENAAPSPVGTGVVGPTVEAGTADADATVRDAAIDVRMEATVLPGPAEAAGQGQAGPGPADGGYDANHDSGIDGETTGALSGAPCESNATCQSNQVCLGSHCKNFCQTDLDCPTNWSCTPYVGSDGGVS